MKVRDYEYVAKQDSGSTDFEINLIDYFKIDKSKTIDEVNKILTEKLLIKEKILKRKYFWFNKKLWKLCIPLSTETFEQWSYMESIISEGDNTKNLHRLLAIYLRPITWYGKIKPFNLKYQDKYENELLDFDMSTASSIMVFFSLIVWKFMNNIKIYSLNQQKKKLLESTMNK